MSDLLPEAVRMLPLFLLESQEFRYELWTLGLQLLHEVPLHLFHEIFPGYQRTWLVYTSHTELEILLVLPESQYRESVEVDWTLNLRLLLLLSFTLSWRLLI